MLTRLLDFCRYQALYQYRPQNEDELELREGDCVDVMQQCDDGWFVGMSAFRKVGTFKGVNPYPFKDPYSGENHCVVVPLTSKKCDGQANSWSQRPLGAPLYLYAE